MQIVYINNSVININNPNISNLVNIFLNRRKVILKYVYYYKYIISYYKKHMLLDLKRYFLNIQFWI